MADKFEKKLFQLAGREKIIPPETLGDKIEIRETRAVDFAK